MEKCPPFHPPHGLHPKVCYPILDVSLPDSLQILYVGENYGEELGTEAWPFSSLSGTLAINRHKFVNIVLLPGDHLL